MARDSDRNKAKRVRVDVFTWRRAIESEAGPPERTTRHVLLSLSNCMTEEGDGAWPSQATLARRCLMTRRSIITHVNVADLTGWLARTRGPQSGKGWALTGYVATVPEHVFAALPKSVGGERRSHGGEPRSPPRRDGGERRARKVVKNRTHGGETDDNRNSSKYHPEDGEEKKHAYIPILGTVTTPQDQPKEKQHMQTTGSLELTDVAAEHDERASAATPIAATRKRTFKMPADWQPNAVNRAWLTDAGMRPTRQTEVIAEFVQWARISELLKGARGWQQAFHQNPLVKKAVAAAKRGGNGHDHEAHHRHRETAHDRAVRERREWAEERGIPTDDLG
jgi:hypothetical protein